MRSIAGALRREAVRRLTRPPGRRLLVAGLLAAGFWPLASWPLAAGDAVQGTVAAAVPCNHTAARAQGGRRALAGRRPGEAQRRCARLRTSLRGSAPLRAVRAACMQSARIQHTFNIHSTSIQHPFNISPFVWESFHFVVMEGMVGAIKK